MALNKNALIRYKTIDKCLQNRFRKWTLDDLIDACSDALYEYEGKDCNVSKRTVQLDIQNMRSDKLGYNAPIIVVDRKYYTYEEEKYSITNLPISSQDLEKLSESVAFLKQFKGFSHFDELTGVIQKLEDHVYSSKTSTRPVIEFEKNEHLKGLDFLDELYQTVIHHKTIKITYKSFKARQASTFVFHAYLLKEFRNRWFVIGIRNQQKHLVNLALDRIIELNDSKVEYEYNTKYDLEHYFSKAIGVSINPDLKTEEILLFVYNKHAPYVLTKPFHFSQKLIKKDNFGITISLNIQHNFELEKEILGLGEGIRVISPSFLKRRIKERLVYASESYLTEISKKGLVDMSHKITYKGSAIVNQIFSLREVKRINNLLHAYFKKLTDKLVVLDSLIEEIPKIEELIFNENLQKITNQINPKATLIKSIFYKKVTKEIIAKNWFQETEKKGFVIRIHLKETTDKNHLKIMLASHNKFFTKNEIDLIVENGVAFDAHVRVGGVQVLDYSTLRKWETKSVDQNIYVIELAYKINNEKLNYYKNKISKN